MQFLVYDPNPNPESSAPPSPELMAEVNNRRQKCGGLGWFASPGPY